ncbi:MAG: hypothetical protein ACTSQI_04790 [Candidatus Helarchaeota archaeon]
MSKAKEEAPKPREIDPEKQKQNYELCGGFLKRMDIKNLKEIPDEFSYEIPLKFTFSDGYEIKLKTLFRVNDRHIMAKCLLLFYKDIKRSRDIDLKMNTLLLQANFNLFDVTYSIDMEQNVFVEMDIIPTANFEAFEDELRGLFYGIEYFFNKVMVEVFKEIKRNDTYNRYIG